MIAIGIDPGTSTGIAIWDTEGKNFPYGLKTMKVHEAIERVMDLKNIYGASLIVLVVEDPNKISGFKTKNSHARAQGAGSVKRDFAVWRDFAKTSGIFLIATKPRKKLTKEYWYKLTKYVGSTSGHARDAAMLVFGTSTGWYEAKIRVNA